MLLLRALVVWLVIIGVETVHGMLRILLLAPVLGDLRARQVSVLTGSALIFVVTYLLVRWMAAQTTVQWVGVGLLWVILTVLFEFGLGRFVLNLSWDRLIEDYDITRGGLLGLGLLVMGLCPLLAARLRNRDRVRG